MNAEKLGTELGNWTNDDTTIKKGEEVEKKTLKGI